MKRLIAASALALALAGCSTGRVVPAPATATVAPAPATSAAPASASEAAATPLVEKIVDGDTLDVRQADGTVARIRVLGVNTAERGKCSAREATAALAAMLPLGSPVTLEPDPTQDDHDRYGRLLRYVHTADGGDVSTLMVRAGWAEVYTAYPVVETPALLTEQDAAQAEPAGRWKLCGAAG